VAVSAAERRFLLDQIDRLAQRDLNNLWRAAELLATNEFFDYVLAGFPEIALNYHQVAAQAAANWFEESDPDSGFVARVAEPPPVGRLETTTRWALGGDGADRALSRMNGALQRATFDGARDTVFDNIEATGSRWIRVARPTACAFCRLLATRTGESAYTSRESAMNVVGRRGGRRGSRRVGEKFHDHCYCQPVEIRANQELSEVLSEEDANRVQQWNDDYLKARANAGSGQLKPILAAWRQQGIS